MAQECDVQHTSCKRILLDALQAWSNDYVVDGDTKMTLVHCLEKTCEAYWTSKNIDKLESIPHIAKMRFPPPLLQIPKFSLED